MQKSSGEERAQQRDQKVQRPRGGEELNMFKVLTKRQCAGAWGHDVVCGMRWQEQDRSKSGSVS